MLAKLLAHPKTRGLNIDSAETTHIRRQILAEKKFLRRIYQGWYRDIAAAVPPGDGGVLEIGSGAGFCKDHIPGLITSDILPLPEVDRVVDAENLPFPEGSLRAVVMNNVLHHVPNVQGFFEEAARCVRPGGAVVMLEPWVTWWSRLIYGRMHHEPFMPSAAGWDFPTSGPLSGANVALPWILFARDRQLFERTHPQWRVQAVTPQMPFRYLVSGGISLRSLTPAWTYALWGGLEKCLQPWINHWAMFALIILRRVHTPPTPDSR